MAGFRDFDAAIKEKAALRAQEEDGGVLRFMLGGELFEVPAKIPATPMLTMIRGHNSDNEQVMFVGFVDFMERVLDDAGKERFDKALDASGADLEDLLDIPRWVMEEVTGRPFTRALDSQPLPSSGGDSSKVDSPSPEVEAPST